ncbi:hypothetical protein V6N13_064543 [Hibiscus sabdariffa]|uniref:Uncharacterized protein n=1 Tax=Hibiscus sabdariffa TaxID=183260 RepID=A0ABR2EAD6_9ROSI
MLEMMFLSLLKVDIRRVWVDDVVRIQFCSRKWQLRRLGHNVGQEQTLFVYNSREILMAARKSQSDRSCMSHNVIKLRGVRCTNTRDAVQRGVTRIVSDLLQYCYQLSL